LFEKKFGGKYCIMNSKNIRDSLIEIYSWYMAFTTLVECKKPKVKVKKNSIPL